MTMSLLLSLVLVLSAESMPAPTVSYEYEEIRLALQWPTSYCNTGKITCNTHIPHELTVHGLWPNPYSDNFFKCPTPNASIKNLYGQVRNDVWTDLGKYWPNLNTRFPPYSLCKYEYETHGHCFRGFQKPGIYFQETLYIAKYILHNISLRRGSISYRYNDEISLRRGRYRVEDFRQVTIAGIKVILGLRCNYARQSNIPQLLEIVICMDRNKKLKDCNNYVYQCRNQWWDSRGVEWSGWFVVP